MRALRRSMLRLWRPLSLGPIGRGGGAPRQTPNWHKMSLRRLEPLSPRWQLQPRCRLLLSLSATRLSTAQHSCRNPLQEWRFPHEPPDAQRGARQSRPRPHHQLLRRRPQKTPALMLQGRTPMCCRLSLPAWATARQRQLRRTAFSVSERGGPYLSTRCFLTRGQRARRHESRRPRTAPADARHRWSRRGPARRAAHASQARRVASTRPADHP